MKKPEKKNILVSVPIPLLKRVESSARAQNRSRTAEVCMLLDRALKGPKTSRPAASASA